MAVWRITASGTLYAQEAWANVFHVNPGGAFDEEAVFDAFEAFYDTAASGGGMRALNPCPGEVSTGVIGVRMTQLTAQAVVDPAIPFVRTLIADGGQNAAGGLPLDCSIIISWRTASAGRSFRGRTYLPPFHSNQIVDGASGPPHLTSATRVALAVQAEALLDALVAANAPLAVYSRKEGVGANTIVGGYIDDQWDTQRRRGKAVAAARSLFPAA